MGTKIDILVAVLGWGIVGYLIYRERVLQSAPVISVPQETLRDNWRLSLCLAIYFTFSIGSLTQRFDALFPWHQTSRLLAYISVGWAVWWLNRMAVGFTDTQLSRRTRSLPWVMTAVLISLFPFSLARSPRPAYDLSPVFLDTLFRDLLYAYILALAIPSAVACWRLLYSEANPLMRLRLGLTLASLSAASGLTITKIVASILRFYTIYASLSESVAVISHVLQISMVLSWLFIYPVRMAAPILRVWHSVRSLWLLKDLRRVERQVRRFCNPIAAETPTFWETLLRPDYYATRSLIHILDGRKQLSSHADPEAIYLRQQLDGVEGQMDTPELLTYYARLGRQIRREGRQAIYDPQENSV